MPFYLIAALPLGREVAGRNWPSPWSTHCLGAQGSVLWKGLWFSYTTEDAVMNHFVWLLHEDPQIPKAWHLVVLSSYEGNVPLRRAIPFYRECLNEMDPQPQEEKLNPMLLGLRQSWHLGCRRAEVHIRGVHLSSP